MDTNICGLNKVVCRASSSSYAGRTVTITNGVNTWSGTIAEITGVGYACVFMVPSLPAPAKRTYTVTLYNSEGTSPEYQRDIELGFGDSIVIGLYTNAEIADKAYVLSEIASHAYVLPKATSSSLGGVMVPSANGLSVDANGNVRMSVAGTDSVGVVKPGTGLQINSTTGAISLKQADASNLGGVKVGTGLSINGTTGVLSLKKADASNLGGIKVGTGLSMDSTTEKLSVNAATPSSLGGIILGDGLTKINNKTVVKYGSGLENNSGELRLAYFNNTYFDVSVSHAPSPLAVVYGSFTLYSDDPNFYNLRYGIIDGIEAYYSSTRQDNALASVTKVDRANGYQTVYYAIHNTQQYGSLSVSKLRVNISYRVKG